MTLNRAPFRRSWSQKEVCLLGNEAAVGVVRLFQVEDIWQRRTRRVQRDETTCRPFFRVDLLETSQWFVWTESRSCIVAREFRRLT